MKSEKVKDRLFIFMVILAIGAIVYLYVDGNARIKEENTRWEHVSGKTYTSDSKEEIYITTRQDELSALENNDIDKFYVDHHYSMILNSKTNYYRSPKPIIIDLYGQLKNMFDSDILYLAKKNNGTLSVAKITSDNIYDEREDKNSKFTVTIKQLDNKFRIYLTNNKKEYNSDGLP
jgi:hypothetical protein